LAWLSRPTRLAPAQELPQSAWWRACEGLRARLAVDGGGFLPRNLPLKVIAKMS